MNDAGTPASPASAASGGGSRLDTTLSLLIVFLAAGLVILGLWWAYSAYTAANAQRLANPAMRVIDQLRAEVDKKPKEANGHVRLGEALAAAGFLDEAIAQFKQATQLNKTHVGAYLDLGRVLLDKKDDTNAEVALKKVVDLTEGAQYENINAQREIALFELGSLKLEQKHYGEAVGYLKGALRIRRDASDTYVALARALRGNGDKDAAIEQLDIALAFDPNYAEARYELGTLYKEKGNLAGAAEQLRKAADIAPTAQPPKTALASFGPVSKYVIAAQKAQASKQWTKASDNARIALALDPKNVAAALMYADALDKLGKKANALAAYKQILKDLDSKNAAARAAVTRLSAKSGK